MSEELYKNFDFQAISDLGRENYYNELPKNLTDSDAEEWYYNKIKVFDRQKLNDLGFYHFKVLANFTNNATYN